MIPEVAGCPRFAYISEVPARALTAGPAVLHRMFECLPPGRVLLCEDWLTVRNLPMETPGGAERTFYRLVAERLLRSRFRDLAGSWFFLRAAAPARALAQRVRKFGAEAVLGMAHGYGWWTAREVARQLQLPFHLLAHDWWSGTLSVHPRLRARAEQRFEICYREAASRFVVSPGMEEEYRRLYGAPGIVLYPVRSPRLRDPALLPQRTPGQPFTFAFAGDAGTDWARRMLAAFANVLATRNARLRVFYSVDPGALRAAGASADNIDIVPFDPDPARLQERIVAGADAMYLPMSFAPQDHRNVTLCFPSKAADYTATGLPILIHAPAGSSAVRWAKSRNDAASVVVEPEGPALAEAAGRFIADPGLRHNLATGGRTAGDDFSAANVMKLFVSQLSA